MALQTKVSEGVTGRTDTNLDDLKRFLLTKHRAQGTLGSTDTSSPHCETKIMQINANILLPLRRRSEQIPQLGGTDLGLAVSLACWKA